MLLLMMAGAALREVYDATAVFGVCGVAAIAPRHLQQQYGVDDPNQQNP